MKIILCYPPSQNYAGYGQDTRWLPLGIASIGAYLKSKNKDLDVVLLDLFKYSEEEALKEIRKYINNEDINIIGFTLMTEQRFSVFNLCKKLKMDEFLCKTTGGEDTIVKTVVGGPHAFIMSQQIADNYDFIDHIIKGEGEIAFYNLVENYINNIEVEKIIQAENCKDLNELPHAIDGFKLFKTKLEIDEAPIIFGRGCTDYCTFCSTTKFWKGYRSRQAQNVFDEMLKWNRYYNCTYFKFHDDAATADIYNLKELCKLIINNNSVREEDEKFKFEMTARADQFDDELIKLLKQAGCSQIAVGIESGNEKLRKSMNKNLDIDLAKENMKKLMQEGIKVGMLLIVGYPGETDDTINDTVNLIREVKPTLTFKQPLMVFPGTKVYEDLKKTKWIDDSYWLKDQPQPYYYREFTPQKVIEWIDKINRSSRNLKVLLAVPARQKEEIFKLHIDSLNRLVIPDYVELDRLFLLHNSENLQKFLSKCDIVNILNTNEKYDKDNTTHRWKHNNLQMITNIKNSIMQYALQFGYDYIFWVDSDLVLHKNTLQSLIESGKNIISEAFWTKWEPNQPSLPNAWDFDHYGFYKELGSPADRYKEKGIHKCGGTGACILVDTRVYKSGSNYSNIYNVSFWGEDRNFSIRSAVNGYELFVDSKFPCYHIYRDENIETASNLCIECNSINCNCKSNSSKNDDICNILSNRINANNKQYNKNKKPKNISDMSYYDEIAKVANNELDDIINNIK
jgi:radical SAM superfamily enzyme YgiQ (UPF0313 family)